MLLKFFIQAQTKKNNKRAAVDLSLHIAGYCSIDQPEVTFLFKFFLVTEKI